MFEKAIELGVNNYIVWGNLADAYRYTPGYKEKAEEAYQKAIQLAEKEVKINPKDSLVLARLARYYAASGNNEKALVEISGMSGTQVIRTNIHDKKSYLDIAGLAPGVYIVRYITGEDIYSKKLVVFSD